MVEGKIDDATNSEAMNDAIESHLLRFKALVIGLSALAKKMVEHSQDEAEITITGRQELDQTLIVLAAIAAGVRVVEITPEREVICVIRIRRDQLPGGNRRPKMKCNIDLGDVVEE